MKMLIKKMINYITSKLPYDVIVNNITINHNNLLNGRTALITGGTSGIGMAIAEAFLLAGANVIITGRNKDRIDGAIDILSSYKQSKSVICKGIVWNISDVANMDVKVNDLLEILGKCQLDILVNNAGIGGGSLPYCKESEYDEVMDINLKGMFFLSQSIGMYFVRNNIKGNILNISSSSSIRPVNSAYMLSKWGIRGLTLGLAKSLSVHGITVNSIAPGPTATPMLLSENASLVHKTSPLKRYILPSEIANLAVFMCSEMGRAIIGDTIFMTGGVGLITLDDFKYQDWN